MAGSPGDGVGLAELLDADVLVVVDGDDPSVVVASLVRSVGAWPVPGYVRAVVVGRDDAGPTAEVNVVTGDVCRAILEIQPHA